MRAFVYCRVSTEEQASEDHYSLANQEERARAYAKLKGWKVAKVRKDIGSGRDPDRPGFQELLADVRAGNADLVLVYRLDRLSRNVRDIYDFVDLLREQGVEFVSLTEGFDTTNAVGRAMLGVAAVFAQLTREMIAENVRDGLARRAEAGKWNGPKWNPAAVRECARGDLVQQLSLDVVREQLAKGDPPPEQELAHLTARLAELNERFGKWADRLDAVLIDEDQFRSRNAALLAEKTELQSRLGETEARLLERETLEVSLEQVRQTLKDFDRVWEEMTHEERREMLRHLVEELKVRRGGAELKLLFLPPVRIQLPRRRRKPATTSSEEAATARRKSAR